MRLYTVNMHVGKLYTLFYGMTPDSTFDEWRLTLHRFEVRGAETPLHPEAVELCFKKFLESELTTNDSGV